MADGIRLERVSFGYNGTQVFDELTLQVPGSMGTAVIGANGSGKSTLLGLIAGTLRPQSGSIDVRNPEGIALAVQHNQVSETFPITVAEAVAMGRWRSLGLWRRASNADRAIVDYWIAAFDLDDLRRRRLGSLSGGQRQRTLLAQTFAQESPIVLLDEPTVGLDAESRERLRFHVDRLARAGTTVVAATHDVELAGRFDLCVLLGGGRVLATGTPSDVLTESNLAAALTLG
ncbi:zinc ABC transporter ATP-binding protein AztA [Mycobacterium deserti]|uniref:Zinc ABC transporter ATP-binding protein AztA n=1 Tax=Mycobacterium deserti TaxID=2978347 RepID=A0ABT2M914_9MYCO|nr:zinc ABC transporter ATP-binding protein AztA [Mycobacterium deserti]MCT7657910.1 zinc ABC transporter ATP-binding protein AztA [Mycobacterium deserti]